MPHAFGSGLSGNGKSGTFASRTNSSTGVGDGVAGESHDATNKITGRDRKTNDNVLLFMIDNFDHNSRVF
jgi:hypothetical protein